MGPLLGSQARVGPAAVGKPVSGRTGAGGLHYSYTDVDFHTTVNWSLLDNKSTPGQMDCCYPSRVYTVLWNVDALVWLTVYWRWAITTVKTVALRKVHFDFFFPYFRAGCNLLNKIPIKGQRLLRKGQHFFPYNLLDRGRQLPSWRLKIALGMCHLPLPGGLVAGP